ncbi:MAG: ATP phosphoribosyltransferase regulatory subunit [Lachnospiraceae bacterium]|nr:ATP phosphoribosyltransferase regulatory subunit [Candidatus Equihabitans merdae]
MERMLHTPDGVRDSYGEELRRKKKVMRSIDDLFDRYGYDPIDTPSIEFFDVFSKEVGTTASRELYKFFDRDGNTLVLRPDFTPSVARAAAMYFSEEERPLRFYYEGNTFINSHEYQGRLKESTQMGVELLGENSVEADAEIIALTVESLKTAGLNEFQVSIGHVDFFKALVADTNLTDDQIEEIRSLISSKNFFGVETLLDNLNMCDARKRALVSLPQLFGDAEVLEAARELAINERAQASLERLEGIYALLKEKGMEDYVSFDFGALSKYRYYTGIIFQAFAYGSGEAVAKGGRYDTLLGYFGKDDAAVGVGISIDLLMNCLRRKR